MGGELSKEMKEIKDLYKRKRYFEVIFIGVQLLVRMSDSIFESISLSTEEVLADYPEYKKILRVHEIYSKSLRGDDAPRAVIQRPFVELVDFEGCETYSEREVVSILHKVERIITFRNMLAHEYHEKENIKKNLRLRAKDCIDLIKSVEKHPWFG